MKKVIFSFTVILLIGFVCQKMSYAAGISRYYIGYNNGIVSIVLNEIGDFGYTYLGTLGWKTNTREPETTPGGWVYIWKKDGNYYWSGDRHPKNSNEIKRINRDNIGFYIYYYGDSRVYLSYSTGAGYPLVTNIEKQVWPY